MEKRRLTLKALTPDRTVLETPADLVVIRTTEGDLGILPGHESCIASVAPEGTLRVYAEGKETDVLTVLGGFLTIKADEVVVLSAMAERPGQIGAALEEKKRQRVVKEEQERRTALEIQRAEVALRRTLVRRETGTGAILHEKERPGGDG